MGQSSRFSVTFVLFGPLKSEYTMVYVIPPKNKTGPTHPFLSQVSLLIFRIFDHILSCLVGGFNPVEKY